MTPATWVLNELATRRRNRRLPRIGPLPLTALLDRIQAERPTADLVDLRHRRRLHLPPAARQARAA